MLEGYLTDKAKQEIDKCMLHFGDLENCIDGCNVILGLVSVDDAETFAVFDGTEGTQRHLDTFSLNQRMYSFTARMNISMAVDFQSRG